MKALDALQGAGLSAAESKVYLALLETGSTLAGAIIRKTGLHRGTTYQVLARLREKGLVSVVVKGKKQHFEPAEPERVLDALTEQQVQLKDALPEMNALLASSRDTQEVTVYYGSKGIRTVLDGVLDALKDGGAYYDFGASGLMREGVGTYWKTWQNTKRKRGIKAYVLFNEDSLRQPNPVFNEYVGVGRFTPPEFSSATDTMIYNDTVVLFVWTAKPPFAVVIRNAQNAKSYLNQFHLMWKHAKTKAQVG